MASPIQLSRLSGEGNRDVTLTSSEAIRSGSSVAADDCRVPSNPVSECIAICQCGSIRARTQQAASFGQLALNVVKTIERRRPNVTWCFNALV